MPNWLELAEQSAVELIQYERLGVGKCGNCSDVAILYRADDTLLNYNGRDFNVSAEDECAKCHYSKITRLVHILEIPVDDLIHIRVLASGEKLCQTARAEFATLELCSICAQPEVPNSIDYHFIELSSEDSDGDELLHKVHSKCTSIVQKCDHCDKSILTPHASYSYTQFYDVNIWQRFRYVEYREVDNDALCEPCFDEDRNNGNIFYCDRCECYTYDTQTYAGEYYCEPCYDQVIYYCDDCGENYHADRGHDCSEDDSDGVIHNYSYKPAPEMFGQGKYFLGFELEVESTSLSKYDGAEKVQQILAHHAYMKEDGSLNDGFEVVTHPHTLEAYNTQFNWDFLGSLQRMGFRSWNTNTCGLHVHVSRTAFEPYDNRTLSRKETILRRQAHELRFMKLIYDNQRQVERIAGRSSTYSSFEDKGNLVPKVKNGYQSNGRYAAVNTENYATLEVRVFRGSLKETRVRSALEFVHAAVEYTRGLKVTGKNNVLTWSKFVAYIVTNEDKYPNLLGVINQTFNNERLSD